MGWIEAARIAGSNEATEANSITKIPATTSTSGSNGLMLNKKERSKC